MDILSNARKALAVASTLLYRRTITQQSAPMCASFGRGSAGGAPLTARDDNPDKVHEEVVAPEIVGFGPAVSKALVIVIEHAGCVV